MKALTVLVNYVIFHSSSKIMTKNINDNKFLTVTEVSEILRLSVLTIYKYIKTGKISAFEFGGHYRISTTSLNDFIQQHRLDIRKGKFSNE